MDILQMLQKIADRTISEKFVIPDVNFNFFGWEEGQGMYVKDSYIEIANKYTHIDMMYDVFDWQNGVGFYGLIQAGKWLGDERYIGAVKEWLDGHLEKGLPPANINTTAPFLSILEIYKKFGGEHYRELCARRAAFLMSEAKRAAEGALEHTVIGVNMEFSSQIWADSLFMGVLFLAKWGNFTGEKMYLKEAARQMLLHYKYLTDAETKLLFHGYNCEERTHMSGVRWGRANGWGIMAGAEMLDLLPNWFEEYNDIKENFIRHLNAMVKYQKSDGSFHTVIDNPSTYAETTVCSAFIFAALRGKKFDELGLEDMHIKNCCNYLYKQIQFDGTVAGASGGTPVMRSVEEYNKIPCVMSYYAQGMALIALLEILKTLTFSRS